MRAFAWQIIADILTIVFTGGFFFILSFFSMEIDDQISIIIVKILQVLLTDGLIGKFFCDLKVGERFRFIVLEDFDGIVGVILVYIIGLCLEAEFLLHAREISQELLRAVVAWRVLRLRIGSGGVLLYEFDLVEDILLGCARVRRILFYFWIGSIIF